MLNNNHFYYRTIRKIVVAFGTIFNDLQVVRFTKDGVTPKEIFKVPLSYGPKEKYIQRLLTDPTTSKSVSVLVPRISFEMTGMTYDVDRKRITAGQNFSSGTGTYAKTQYNPIPYNFDFSVSVYVRNTEDGTQIIEQILPFFTPDYTVTVDFIPEMSQTYDMPIILNSISNMTEYEGDFDSQRLIIWTLDFTLKGYIWPPIKTSKLITQSNTNIETKTVISYVNGNAIVEDNFTEQQILYVDYANGVNYFAENEIVRTDDKFGTVSYFSNNSTGLIILTNTNELFQVGDELKGQDSLARYTVTDVTFKSNTPTVQIVIVPDPENAGPNDDFGFNESIIENGQ